MKTNMSFIARLIVVAFFVLTGCGQSPEMKSLQDTISKAAEKIEKEAEEVKDVKSTLGKKQKEYENKVEELCNMASDELKGYVKDHGKITDEAKELSSEMAEISSKVSALPKKLNENMRFNMSLIQEDFEHMEKRAEEIKSDADKIERKHEKYDKKISQLTTSNEGQN